MKKNIFLVSLALVSILFSIQTAYSQLIFLSTHDTTAIVGEQYSYMLEVSPGSPDPVVTLEECPAGMTITKQTGTYHLIIWTPSDIYSGGLVRIKADYDGTVYYEDYYVYVSDEIVCDERMISYHTLEEASGPFADIVNSYDAIDLTSPGELVDTVGIVGQGISQRPISINTEFLSVADVGQYDWNSNADSFSISIWFNARGNTWNDDQIMVGKGDLNNFIVVGLDGQTPGKLIPKAKLLFSDDTLTLFPTEITVTINQWHHMVITYEGVSGDITRSEFKMYYDGVLERNIKEYISDYDIAPNGNLQIGWWNVGALSKLSFDGRLDEVIIYDNALDSTEIKQMYQDGLAGNPACAPGNFAPIVTTSLPTEIDEDIPFLDTVTYKEIDDDIITLTANTLPSWLNFNTSTGVLSGTPTNDNVGDTTIVITVNDGTVDVEETYSLTVNNVNDDPVITSTASTAVDEDVLYSYQLTYTDDDAGDVITLSAPVLPSFMSFNTTSGILSFTPTNTQVGTDPYRDYDVTLRIEDLESGFDEEIFTIRITNINDAPEIINQNLVSTDEDVAVTISFGDLVVSDVDNVYPDDFTLIVSTGTNYSVNGNTITPAQNWNGELTVPIILNDGTVSVDYDLSVTVNSVNDDPVITTTPGTLSKEGALYVYVFAADDVDEGDVITYSVIKKPDWLSFVPMDGVLTGTPGNDDIGTDTISLKAADQTSGFAIQTYVLTIENENNAPVITSTAVLSADDYELYEYTITATDADVSDILVFSAVNIPDWLEFNAATQLLSGTPAWDDIGTDSVTLEVTDSFETTPQSFVITVGNENSLPVITSTANTSAYVDSVYVYNITATDVDENDVITYSAKTIPTWLVFSTSTNVLSGKPTESDKGNHDIVLEVTDGTATVEQSFTITVDGSSGLFETISQANNIISRAYPNPAQEFVHFNINTLNPITIQIVDITGKKVVEYNSEGTNKININISGLNQGLYFYYAKSGNEYQTGKLTIK